MLNTTKAWGLPPYLIKRKERLKTIKEVTSNTVNTKDRKDGPNEDD